MTRRDLIRKAGIFAAATTGSAVAGPLLKFPGGMVVGATVVPPSPSAETLAFFEFLIADIAAGMGIPVEMLERRHSAIPK